MVSAVPAGEVMAREDVFGIVSPCAATIATTIGVVRFPGKPPTQCLSITGETSQSPASSISRMPEETWYSVAITSRPFAESSTRSSPKDPRNGTHGNRSA